MQELEQVEQLKEAITNVDASEIEALAKDMGDAETISEISQAQNMSGKVIKKMQLNAHRLAMKAKRLGKHVIHPTKVGKYQAIADSYYGEAVGQPPC